MDASDTQFTGSIPGLYDRYLGPLLFQPYADHLADCARRLAPGDILETAAGTGILTGALARALPASRIVATDLNPAMTDCAAGQRAAPNVRFATADALALPLPDAGFDLVACQFGAMFFPDKPRGHAEAYRVLRPGGHYLLAMWDRIERNPVSLVAHNTVAGLYPADPPSFLRRVPFGYSNPLDIRQDVERGGFATVLVETVGLNSLPVSAVDAARGLVAGSPLRIEIEERDADGLDAAIDAVAAALRPHEVDGALPSRLSAHVVVARKRG